MRDAVLGYLGVAITGFVVPLEVYLVSTRRSAFAHQHAAEALRVAWAAVLYGICALIIGGMLALDSVTVAVIVVGPLALAFWLVLVVHPGPCGPHGLPEQSHPRGNSWPGPSLGAQSNAPRPA